MGKWKERYKELLNVNYNLECEIKDLIELNKTSATDKEYYREQLITVSKENLIMRQKLAEEKE